MLSNPELVSAMMKKNPETAEIMKQHPELEATLANPSMLKSLMSPEMLKSASGMIERMQSLPSNTTMSGRPGSFPMPGSPDKKEEKRETPNPWGTNPFAQMMAMNRMGVPPLANTGVTGTREVVPNVTATSGTTDDRVKYKDQLEEMKAIGFADEEENLKALRATNGDVFEAIDKVANKT